MQILLIMLIVVLLAFSVLLLALAKQSPREKQTEDNHNIQNTQEASRFLSIFSNYHFSRNFRTSASGSPENLEISSGENLESCSMRCAVSKACS